MADDYILIFADLKTKKRVRNDYSLLSQIDKISTQCNGIDELSSLFLRGQNIDFVPNYAYILRQANNEYERLEISYSNNDIVAQLASEVIDYPGEYIMENSATLLYLIDIFLNKFKEDNNFRNFIMSYIDQETLALIMRYLADPNNSQAIYLKLIERLREYSLVRKLAIGLNKYMENEMKGYNDLIDEEYRRLNIHHSIDNFVIEAMAGGERELERLLDACTGAQIKQLDKLTTLIQERNENRGKLKI
jgi:hypothetical protein